VNVGFIGLGRVGLVMALCMEKHGGHKVVGYDISPLPAQVLAGQAPPPAEEGIGDLLDGSQLTMLDSVADVVDYCDLIMVCVQTPHPGGWTGSEPMDAPSDFDYSYLTQAVQDVAKAAAEQDKPLTLVIVSTVLPGTCERLLLPLLPEGIFLVYGPSLISLGTVARDFLEPEVVIAGQGSLGGADPYVNALTEFLPDGTAVCVMSLASAELAKMSYNLFTVAKLAVSGTIARLADQCGADADEVTAVLSHGTRRLLSPMYLKAGMPAAGPCHPRDVNALAWLAGDDGPCLPEFLASDREEHARWLAGIVRREHERTGLPILLLGADYKPGAGVTAGSAALLVAGYLKAEFVFDAVPENLPPQVFFIGCADSRYAAYSFPEGSVVIDPHGYIPAGPGVTLITPGRRR
jgi:UDPglucose 6-dehydrogenase